MTETVTHKSSKGKVRKPKVIAESAGGAANAEKPHKETEGRTSHKKTSAKDHRAPGVADETVTSKKKQRSESKQSKMKQPSRKAKEPLVNGSNAQTPRTTRSDSKKAQKPVVKDQETATQKGPAVQQPARKPCRTCLNAASQETDPARAAQREEMAKSHSRSNNKLCPAYKGRRNKQPKEQ